MRNKNKIFIIIFVLLVMVSLMVTNINTSAIAVAGETPMPTVDVTAGVTTVPNMGLGTTAEPDVAPTSEPEPPTCGISFYSFSADQSVIYSEKTTITGELYNVGSPATTVLSVKIRKNGNVKTLLSLNLPAYNESTEYSLEVDFSKCDVGDEVLFVRDPIDSPDCCVMSFWSNPIIIQSKPLETPDKTVIKRVRKIGKRKIRVVLKKVKNVSGYKVSYSTNKKFKGTVTKTKTSKTNTVIIKGLKAGKYFVKAQTYNAFKGSKTKYSKSSKLKKVSVR